MKTINLTTIQNKDLIIDVSRLVSDEVLYINATKLALQFGKNKYQLRDFFKSDNFLEYEKAIFKVVKKPHFKTDDKPLRYSLKGKYGGTYLHSDLVMVFLRWLSIEFAVKCDMYIKAKIQEMHNDKLVAKTIAQNNKTNLEWVEVRTQAKGTRKSLTKTITAFCEYAQRCRGKNYLVNKCSYHITFTKLIYKVLGIEKPKSNINRRDVFNGAIIEKIEHLEIRLIKLINYHLKQETEYHKAYKEIKKSIEYEASLFDEVA